MKIFIKIVLLLSLLSLLHAESTVNYDLSTDDIENPSVLNTLGPVDILDLSGYYSVGRDIERFKIVSLPDPSSGILYLEDGETEVQVGQVLEDCDADGLRFDPNPDFVGNATFQYASVNSNGEVDSTPATVTIPVYAKESNESDENVSETVGTTSTPNEECLCEDYDSAPSLSLWGVLLMMIITLTIAKEEFNREF